MSDPKNSTSKTLECMVCGKTFSRGPVDLARHQTAVTLKHLVSTTTSSQFSFGCRKCNIYFTSKEHLSLHRAQSSCGQPLSKSVVVTSTSAIIRSKPVKPVVDPIILKSEEEGNNTSSSATTTVTSSRGTPRHAASVAAAAIAAFHGVGGHSKDKLPPSLTPAPVPDPTPVVAAEPAVTQPVVIAVVPEIKESIKRNKEKPEALETKRHSTRTRHPNPNISSEGSFTSTPTSSAILAVQSSSSSANNKQSATVEVAKLVKGKRGRPSSSATAQNPPVAGPVTGTGTATAPTVTDRQKSRKKAMTIEELTEFQRANKRQRVIIPEGSSLSYLFVYI